MAIQQLTQPILNPITAFDATKSHSIDFVVIGGAQVIGNRLVISNNQTGEVVYDQLQSTMKLEHIIPANTLVNGNYYNAVIYTVDNGGNESSASVAIPFYCYSQPVLTIDNIPATETIENGTYTFSGTYLQQEREDLNSYQYTLYNSNKEILSQSPLIYYSADNSLSYTFVGMSNDTSYYVELTGQTVNGTFTTSGLRYFTIRYLQPASFAICDLVNDCEDGYIQISSNIVAIDGHSNPDPPIYIDDKEVDLRDPNSWVEWNEGFRIQSDFTMRVWGRDFNPYQNIITLTNDINSSSKPNRIEMKWMIGDIIKTLPKYNSKHGYNVNLEKSEADEVKKLSILGHTKQKIETGKNNFASGEGIVSFDTLGRKKIAINISGYSYQETRSGRNKLPYPYKDLSGTVIQDLGDGRLILNGTVAENTYKIIQTFELKAGKYKILFSKTNIPNHSYILMSGKTSGQILQGKRANTSFELTNDDTVTLGISILKGTYNQAPLDLMILEATEQDETYEQYGASPSPEYPSEIRNVGDNINLINENEKLNFSAYGATVTDTVLRVNTNYIGYLFECKPNTSYTISRGDTKSERFRGFCFDEDPTKNLQAKSTNGFYGDVVAGGVKTEATFTTTENSKYIYVLYGYNNVLSIEAKAEEGEQATPYSPFNCGNIEIEVCNKNVANTQKLFEEMKNFKPNSVRTELVDGRNCIVFNNSGFLAVDGFKGLKGHYQENVRYVIRGQFRVYNTSLTSGVTLYLSVYDKNGNIIATDANQAQGSQWIQFSCITDEGSSLDYIAFSYGNSTLWCLDMDSLEIYASDKVEDFIAHKQQTIVFPFTEGQRLYKGDYLAGDGIHHVRKQRIFDGTEVWQLGVNGNNTTNQRFFIYKDFIKANGNIACNYLKQVYKGSIDIFNNDVEGCNISNGKYIQIKINKKIASTLDELHAWIKQRKAEGNPLIFECELEKEEIEPYTPKQNTIYNNLMTANSYIGQNNVYSTINDLLPIGIANSPTPTPYNPSKIYSVGDIKNLIDIKDFNIQYNQDYNVITFTKFKLKPNYIYTLSFDYEVNSSTTDLYFTVGYGKDNKWIEAITKDIQYKNLSSDRNTLTFVVPDTNLNGEPISEDMYMYFKFAGTIILADVDVNISNIQLEAGGIATDYQAPNIYNVYPTVIGKNIYNYKTPLYLKKNNTTYSSIQNGYNIQVVEANKESNLAIGWNSILNPKDTYAISYNYDGDLAYFKLYTTDKESQERLEEIELNNGVFVAPEGLYDLQLVVGLNSDNASNSLEIWNIQIEANDSTSEYEVYQSTNSTLTLNEPLMAPATDVLSDLVSLKSINILNPKTQSAEVEGEAFYTLMQEADTTYYVWFYNSQGNLIKFLDPEGHEKSGEVINGTGIFQAHKDCVKVILTKSNNPEAKDVTEDELIENEVYIEKGYVTDYYPYFETPSIVRKNRQIILNGTENWVKRTNTNHTFQIQGRLPKILRKGVCDYYKAFNDLREVDKQDGINLVYTSFIFITDMRFTEVEDFKNWLSENNVTIQAWFNINEVQDLTIEQANSLKGLRTFAPISNVFTNNKMIGDNIFDYVEEYSEQQTQGAYVQLKCYNASTMPYFIHSNYIDIPEDTNKVFIWLRRKNNLFDLKIEDLGDYGEEDYPTDKDKPIVTLDINQRDITQTTIPVTAHSIDETGLRTIRFSKDNGVSWDEIIPVDGLSSTNSYTFKNLNPDTFYTIRVEAIDLTGNIGGISQRVTTKA